MITLAEHYLHQLGYVLALRLKYEDEITPELRPLLYYAVSARLDDCTQAGVQDKAHALLRTARQARAKQGGQRS